MVCVSVVVVIVILLHTTRDQKRIILLPLFIVEEEQQRQKGLHYSMSPCGHTVDKSPSVCRLEMPL